MISAGIVDDAVLLYIVRGDESEIDYEKVPITSNKDYAPFAEAI